MYYFVASTYDLIQYFVCPFRNLGFISECLVRQKVDGLALNPIALRTAKTLWSFGRSECNRVKIRLAPVLLF